MPPSRLLLLALAVLALPAAAQSPKTFIDYFLPTPIVSPLSTTAWGAATVGPRDQKNGLEDPTMKQWDYWDGQIIHGPDGKYHIFASRWDQSFGHNAWFRSKAVHAVSDSLIGPYEDMFLYRTTVGPEAARAIFLTYIRYLNHLKDHPDWYNAVTRNCTTTLDKPISKAVTNPQPWIYQILLNGTLDELLYNRGRLVTDGLPFKELKSRAHINAAAKAADKSLNFSAIIRTNAPGFGNSQ